MRNVINKKWLACLLRNFRRLSLYVNATSARLSEFFLTCSFCPFCDEEKVVNIDFHDDDFYVSL